MISSDNVANVGGLMGPHQSIWDDGYRPDGAEGHLPITGSASEKLLIWDDVDQPGSDEIALTESESVTTEPEFGDGSDDIWGDGYRSPQIFTGLTPPDMEALIDDAFFLGRNRVPGARSRPGTGFTSRLVRRIRGLLPVNPNAVYSRMPYPPDPQLLEKIYGLGLDRETNDSEDYSGDEAGSNGLQEASARSKSKTENVARFLLNKTVELSKKRSVQMAAGVGAYILVTCATLYSLGGDSGNSSQAEKIRAPVTPAVTQVISSPNVEVVGEKPDVAEAPTLAVSPEQPARPSNENDAKIVPGGNLSWSIGDWLRNHGATDEVLIQESTPEIVTAVAVENPELNVDLVYDGQIIRLPQTPSNKALARILAAQAA